MLPGLAVAELTRRSVGRALAQGITSQQILRFLQSHASPIMDEDPNSRGNFEQNACSRTYNTESGPFFVFGSDVNFTEQTLTFIEPPPCAEYPLVASTVADQVILWEKETKRLQTAPGVLFRNFENDLMLARMVEEAQRLGVYIWSRDDRRDRALLIEESGRKALKAFWRSVDWAAELRALEQAGRPAKKVKPREIITEAMVIDDDDEGDTIF
jgi:transcription initiation factor TFIIH subunit 4